MKIDRLLSIIVYLLNHELVPASSLAERFGVSLRTIQRDMETIELAGIPIYAVQGPRGGYGIMESYKMDRQLMGVDDFYYMLTALKGVADSLEDQKLEGTLEKVRSLIPERQADLFAERDEKLSIDFSLLGGDPRQRAAFKVVKEAVEAERLLRFGYTNNKLEQSLRTVEPMTLAFHWRAWYLFAYCREKEDYRLFRISRLKEPEILAPRFKRREKSFDQFLAENHPDQSENSLEFSLRFAPPMRAAIEEFYPEEDCRIEDDGSLTVTARMPEDGWLYGYILSFGQYVEVLAPEHLRRIIASSGKKIAQIYE